jgi:hypothetical protein
VLMLDVSASAFLCRLCPHLCATPSITVNQFEDRPITRERVASVVEHRPVEKRYVTEVR